MIHLKIILYGILAFIERNPKLCLVLVLIGIFAPVVFEVVGWIILGIIALFLIGLGVAAWRMRKMRQEMEQQFRGATGGAASGGGYAGFGGLGNMGGMTLEELVRRMQAEADARKRGGGGTTSQGTTSTSTKGVERERAGDYVDFEEVK